MEEWANLDDETKASNHTNYDEWMNFLYNAPLTQYEENGAWFFALPEESFPKMRPILVYLRYDKISKGVILEKGDTINAVPEDVIKSWIILI